MATLINQETDDFNIHGILPLNGEVYVTNLYNNAGARQGIFRVDTANNEYDQVVSGLVQTTVLRAAQVGVPESEGCHAYDFDGDNDVDLIDFYIWSVVID
jgi:hypothetical protein